MIMKKTPLTLSLLVLAALILGLIGASTAKAGRAGAQFAKLNVMNCRVVKVYDGDTVTAWCGGRKVKIRLAEIDAPEKNQSHGRASQRILANMILGRQIQVRQVDTDRYGRIVGTIYSANWKNVNREMVYLGAAWAYRRYCKDPEMLRLENEARKARRGLWKNPNPVPPWRWRRLHGRRGTKTTGWRFPTMRRLVNKWVTN